MRNGYRLQIVLFVRFKLNLVDPISLMKFNSTYGPATAKKMACVHFTIVFSEN